MLVFVQTLLLSAGIWFMTYVVLCRWRDCSITSHSLLSWTSVRVRSAWTSKAPCTCTVARSASRSSPSAIAAPYGNITRYQLASYNVKPSKSSKLRFKRAVFIQAYTVMFLLVVLTVGIFRFDYRLLNQIK